MPLLTPANSSKNSVHWLMPQAQRVLPPRAPYCTQEVRTLRPIFQVPCLPLTPSENPFLPAGAHRTSSLPLQPTACSRITICHIVSPEHSLHSFSHSGLVDLQQAQGPVQVPGVKTSTRPSPQGVTGALWETWAREHGGKYECESGGGSLDTT